MTEHSTSGWADIEPFTIALECRWSNAAHKNRETALIAGAPGIRWGLRDDPVETVLIPWSDIRHVTIEVNQRGGPPLKPWEDALVMTFGSLTGPLAMRAQRAKQRVTRVTVHATRLEVFDAIDRGGKPGANIDPLYKHLPPPAGGPTTGPQ